MPLTPIASHKAFLGIAKETTKGTPVASTAYIAVHRDTLKYMPGQVLLEDKGARGAPGDVYGHVAGVNWSETSWGGDLFADTIGWIAAGLFGEVAVTGSSAPYTHAFSLLNSGQQQPPAYTADINYAVANRQVPGLQFSELNLSWSSDGLVTYTTKGVGFPSVVATLPTPSFSAAQPIAAWKSTIVIGGTTSAGTLGGEVSIKRTTTRIHVASSVGSPAAVWGGGLSIDGKLTLVMESDTELARLVTPASTTVDVSWQPDANNKAQVTMSKAQYSAAEPVLGKDWVELPITFSADLNTTDVGASGGYGPGKVTLINSIASGVFI
jgi:hypothetical protein